MSTPTPRLALVTGANGYIGARTVGAFLSAGWSVRGTVRDLSSSTSAALAAHLASYIASGRLELVSVPDITTPNAFDAAMRGVTAVAHLASPVVLDSDDPDYVLGTAVGGTLGALESALRASSESSESKGLLKSFVLMSSIVAVGFSGSDGVVTEADWNTEVEEAMSQQGAAEARGMNVYVASKIASERALWKWVAEKKPAFATSAVNPVWVAGPPLYLPLSADQIHGTNQFIWQVLSGQEYPPGPPGYGTHVDVRDVARLSVFAAEHPDIVDGQRYIAGGNGNFGVPQAAADVLREAYPDRRDVIKKGTPGQGYEPRWASPPNVPKIVSDKAVAATGQSWIPYDKMVLDAAKMFEAFL
ncbi:Uu.00g027400.m01.CDS01 [Anthostomella pinea]|uniref:Uu.00g027400.m01.CDS01 n=1 Tax=Anthostomella pinea TaxID=933095 RepID=A0AAI8V8A4_9PEZI|nr:Uu.00g027400.m01.CDS01 [Anthostomella pinea]